MLKKIRALFIKKDTDDEKIKWSLYKKIWVEIGQPQWKWLLVGIIATIIAAGAEGFTLTLLKQIVDEAFINKDAFIIYMVGLQIIGAFTVKGIFNYTKSLTMAKAGLLGSARLQNRIYKHMVKMDISKFYGGGIGKHLNYFSVQANAVKNLVTSTIIDIVQNIATLVITVGIMLWYAPQMCAVLLFLVPAIMVPMVLIMNKRRKLTRKSFTISNTSAQHLNQTLRGIKTIQSFGNEEVEENKFRKIIDVLNGNSYKQTQVGSIQSPLLEFMISIGLCLALIVGGSFIISGVISTGDFTVFILALVAAYKPAKGVTGIGNTVQHGLLAAEVLFDFLDTEPTIKDTKNAKELKSDKICIDFENVHFSYIDGEPVLKDINLSVPSGKVCALVGPSGGGKTTMFNLLERFYEPQKGKIKINDTDIKKYTLNSLRKNISEVSQDVFLFNGSVIDNIRYGAPQATKKQVEDAAMAANAHDFIMELPKKYNASVGEGGALLSGGQKQRIAIARAILKDSPILLLDEATSALDSESEKLIQESLEGLMKNRTTFVIAHRLSTILDADMICVIKDGKIIEKGTDKELVKLDGEYKKLRDIQFQED